MTFDDFPQHEIFTGFEFDFKAIRVFDGELFPVSFRLRTELAPLEGVVAPTAVGETFAKIHYFVTTMLENSILINRMDEWSAGMFVDLETGLPNGVNNLVHLSEDPTNIAVVKALHAKFAALAAEGMSIGYLNIRSNDATGMAITSVGDPSEELPDIEDWVGERHYFSKPWWHRDDASTMDIVPDEDANLAEPPAFAYSLAFLLDQPEPQEDAPEKVVRVEFRPRIIQGGKKD